MSGQLAKAVEAGTLGTPVANRLKEAHWRLRCWHECDCSTSWKSWLSCCIVRGWR